VTFRLVFGRIERDESGARTLVASPDLAGVDLTGDEVHLVYAYENDDARFATAAAVELTEAWTQAGADHIRAIPYRLTMSWPADAPRPPTDELVDARELDRE
jgi:hypothetical protein